MTRVEVSDTSRKNRGATWKTIAQGVFLGAALIAAGYLLQAEGAGILDALGSADPGLIALALVAAIGNVLLTGLSWRALLAEAPVQLSARQSARIFFVGQIGKYLPGTVWSFLASGELARQAGLARGPAMASLLLALLIGLGAGVVVVLLTVPQALGLVGEDWALALLLLPVAAAFLHPRVRAALLRFARIDFPISLTALGLSGALALLAWVFSGAQVLLLAQSVGAGFAWTDLGFATGAYAFAWIAGFIVLIAPAGLGAREGGLLAMLTMTMGLADAGAVVLLSRLAVTLADFACAGIALIIPPTRAVPATAPPLHRG